MDQLTKYFKATAAEMKQVSWPTQQQAWFYTALVMVISIIVALYVGAFDFLFSEVINLVVNNF